MAAFSPHLPTHACVNSLAALPGLDDVSQISGFGLDAQGVRLETAGDCQARLAIESGEASLTWSRDGKPVKSVPAIVKSAHSDLVAELKKAAKELNAALSTQLLRLEQAVAFLDLTFNSWKRAKRKCSKSVAKV